MYCQKCRTPLKTGTALDNLNPAAFDLLAGSASRSENQILPGVRNYPQDRKDLFDLTTRNKQIPQYRRSIRAPNSDDHGGGNDEKPTMAAHMSASNAGMSFVEITESQVMPLGRTESTSSDEKRRYNAVDESALTHDSLSWRINRQDRLFSILSSHSDIDYPVCHECSTILLSQLNARLVSSNRERDAYTTFLKSIQQAHTQLSNDDSTTRKLDELRREERQIFDELSELEKEKLKLELELADLENDNRHLTIQEQTFWKSRNAFDERLYAAQMDLTSLQERYANDQRQLERLQRTNVYNDTFCIGHDGSFGTINNLRLGRSSSHNVEWAEINAAWGQTVLLLATIADRVNFQFQGFRLKPLGSTSRIDKLDWPQHSSGGDNSQRALPLSSAKLTPLDLFSSGEMPLGRMFNHRRFDAGMVAFLECLLQLGKHIEKTSKSTLSPAHKGGKSSPLVLPYSISGDKIGDVSIRLGAGFSQDENFTKACKYTLTCCKFLLAHISNMESLRGG